MPLFQNNLFQVIKRLLPPGVSFVSSIAEVLNLSEDSIYRRMRGETFLTFEEGMTLAKHFNVSLDEMADPLKPAFLFQCQRFDDANANQLQYMEAVKSQVSFFKRNNNPQLYNASKDIPLFYLFAYPEYCAFKLQFWTKSLKAGTLDMDLPFHLDNIPETIMKSCREVYKLYTEIPSVEIWNNETINTNLKQIQYAFDAGWFIKKEDALLITKQLLNVVQLVEMQAREGKKIMVDQNGKHQVTNTPYQLYRNDVMLMDNSIHYRSDETSMVIIVFNTLSYIYTTHAEINKMQESWLHNQIVKSTSLTQAGEKERSRFFQQQKEKVKNLMQWIEKSQAADVIG